MRQLASVDSDIERILKLEEIFVTDPQQWVGYLRHERAQTDYENSLAAKLEEGMRKGEQKGRLEGMRKGEQKGKVETAHKMLAHGMSLEMVIELTGLSENEIRAVN